MRKREIADTITKTYPVDTEDITHEGGPVFTFQDPEGNWVTRFETEGMGGPFANLNNSMTQQGEIFRILNEESDFPAPALRGVHTEVGRPFITVEHFDGEKLKDYARGHDMDHVPDSEDILDLFGLIGESMAETHQITFDEFGEIQNRGNVNPGFPNAYEWLDHALGVQTNFAVDSSAIGSQELGEVESYVRGFMEEYESELKEYDEAVLVVSDVHPGNIKVSKDAESICFYDLEHGRAGMPVGDVYRVESELAGIHEEVDLPKDREEVSREDAFDAFMSGYERKKDYSEVDSALQESGVPFSINLMSLIEYYERKDEDRSDRQEELKDCLISTVEQESPDYDQYREIWG